MTNTEPGEPVAYEVTIDGKTLEHIEAIDMRRSSVTVPSLLGLPLVFAFLAYLPPARAGETMRKVNYQDPNHPEDPTKRVWAWRKQTHGLLYRVTKGPRKGELVTFHPSDGTSEEGIKADRAFVNQAPVLMLELVRRGERRKLYREERARYKAIVRKRNAKIRELVGETSGTYPLEGAAHAG